jgi:hypothetical protein
MEAREEVRHARGGSRNAKVWLVKTGEAHQWGTTIAMEQSVGRALMAAVYGCGAAGCSGRRRQIAGHQPATEHPWQGSTVAREGRNGSAMVSSVTANNGGARCPHTGAGEEGEQGSENGK